MQEPDDGQLEDLRYAIARPIRVVVDLDADAGI